MEEKLWRPVIDSILRWSRYRQGLKKDYRTSFYIKTGRSWIERAKDEGLNATSLSNPRISPTPQCPLWPSIGDCIDFLTPSRRRFLWVFPPFPFQPKASLFLPSNLFHSFLGPPPPSPPPSSIDTNSISVSWSSSKNILILVNWLHAVNVQWTITGEWGAQILRFSLDSMEQMLNRSLPFEIRRWTRCCWFNASVKYVK